MVFFFCIELKSTCFDNNAHSSLALEKILSCSLIVKFRVQKNEKEFIVKRCFLVKISDTKTICGDSKCNGTLKSDSQAKVLWSALNPDGLARQSPMVCVL